MERYVDGGPFYLCNSEIIFGRPKTHIPMLMLLQVRDL